MSVKPNFADSTLALSTPDTTVSSAAGPSRTGFGASGSGSKAGDAMSEGSSTQPRRQSIAPYARNPEPLQQKQPKSSSTTALFNTRKNWSQYILESIEVSFFRSL